MEENSGYIKNEKIKLELYKRGFSNNLLIKYNDVVDYFIELIKNKEK